MKRYRLLKDLGQAKAGQVFVLDDEGNIPYLSSHSPERMDVFLPWEIAGDPNWFEEILPFVPKNGDDIWFIGKDVEPIHAVYHPEVDSRMVARGNFFRTEEQACAFAADLRKFIAVWKEDHP